MASKSTLKKLIEEIKTAMHPAVKPPPVTLSVAWQQEDGTEHREVLQEGGSPEEFEAAQMDPRLPIEIEFRVHKSCQPANAEKLYGKGELTPPIEPDQSKLPPWRRRDGID